jgi:hypothetical protein
VWRAARAPFLLALAVLVTGLLLAISSGTSANSRLDPTAVDPDGSRALAEVLRAQGVDVSVVTRSAALRTSAGADDTVLVAFPERLVASQVGVVLDTGADLVIAEPEEPERFVPGVTAGARVEAVVDEPRCNVPAARRAGSSDGGRLVYDVDEQEVREAAPSATTEVCFPSSGGGSLVQVDNGGRTITMMGNAHGLSNDRLDAGGNAALALGLLGAHPRLLWYVPSVADLPPGEGRTFYDMVPDNVWWGLTQVGIAVLLLGVWRARRLGPVVTEPLPVIVRAAETVEGRARLYRRARARGKAADALRAGARSRLLPLLGLPRGSAPPTVIDAVTRRSRSAGPEVAALLYGAAPADDVALVRLADDLDVLEREVRQP